ncbi:hypothetical protein SDC9_52728 [bioreactor metagenome]|uniref:Uncharacterized protein n=1 Tax=bioreactor metagenome TaxID=1076179 RepID=A0A644WRY1_9ZZZZ
MVYVGRLGILRLGHMGGRWMLSPFELVLLAQIPFQRTLLGTLALVTLPAGDENGDRPETLDIRTQDLQHAGQRYGDEHSRNTPNEPPQGQGDQNDEGREIELASLQSGVDDVSQNHLGADRKNADIDYVRPVGSELDQGHENGQGGDDDRTDGGNEVENKSQDTPKDGQIETGDNCSQEEEQAGEGTDYSFENQILGNLAGDAFKHHSNLHPLALWHCRKQLGNDTLPFQKQKEEEDVDQGRHLGDVQELIRYGSEAADRKTGPVHRQQGEETGSQRQVDELGHPAGNKPVERNHFLGVEGNETYQRVHCHDHKPTSQHEYEEKQHHDKCYRDDLGNMQLIETTQQRAE